MRVTRDAVYVTDEVFMTGTAAAVTPIIEVEGRRIGNGLPGPLTRRLQDRFFACVRGQDAGHADWLTPVLRLQIEAPGLSHGFA